MKRTCGDGVQEGVVGVSEGKLLLEDFCGVFEQEDRNESVLGLCEDEGREVSGASSLVE